MHLETITFGSVCSGLEAASVAWHRLGWRAAWLAEIEPFPAALLAHHYPTVPNYGDMTLLPAMVRAGSAAAPDVLVGGTPCQAFSFAGLRKSLDDARGQLSLCYVDLANAIDESRSAAGLQPCVTVWENVPGVLSTKDNAFGCFLGALCGEDGPLEPPRAKNGRVERWPDAGCVFGPQRAIAWRVIDAQYVGVAQRRRRVFVVSSAREGFDPSELLFEFDGVRRDSAPSRGPVEGAAGSTAAGAGGGGGAGVDLAGTLEASSGRRRGAGITPGFLVPQPTWWDGGQVSQTLDAVLSKGQCMPEKNRFPAVLTPAVAYAFQQRIARNGRGDMGDCVSALTAQAGETGKGDAAPCVAVAFAENSRAEVRLEGGDGSRCGALSTGGGKPGQGSPCVALGFPANLSGTQYASTEDVSPALAAVNPTAVCFKASHFTRGKDGAPSELVPPLSAEADKGDQDPLVLALQDCSGRDKAQNGKGWSADGVAYTVDTHALQGVAVAAADDGCLTPWDCQSKRVYSDRADVSPALSCSDGAGGRYPPSILPSYSWQVRRLTPTECERLQGFPDGYTLVPHRGKPAADGPRYKALGNSMAVPVMAWIGARIDAFVFAAAAEVRHAA